MKIGIALSGGGARGIAHLGVLKALLEKGIRPDIISGVSAGALVGTLYASGLEPDQIMEMLLKTNLYRYVRPAWSRYGFLNIQKLIAIYKLFLPIKNFEDLNIPVIISAADIREGKTIYFSEGDIVKAVLASTCIPILFAPIEMDGKLMVDGGIINNLPVEPLIGQCDLIIGVHTNPNNQQYKIKSIKSMIERTFHLAIYNNVKERVKYCDLFIEPPDMVNYGIFEVSRGKEIFDTGYRYARKMLENSKELLQRYNIGK
jgi:NTE family protein